MAKVLLTGVIGPHGNINFDITGDRLTRDQDIFTLTSHAHFQALHFIAQNISAPCAVLEHPRIEDLVQEVKKGYDYVGINFTLANLAKTFEMCEAIRKVAPNTRIVLGGYGTSCFSTIFRSEEEIHKYADYVCHGEGVSFFRELLGEPVDAPIMQMLGPTGGAGLPWLDPYPEGGGFSCVVSGLGCPNMCEFCSTSHYYGGEFIEMANADQLFEGMKRYWRTNAAASEITIFDENLYKDKEKVTRLGKLIRKDKEFGLSKMAHFGFGTIEDLSRYDVVEDLVMNGVGSIWIGVESLYSDLTKRQGRDAKELFDDLHAHGISTTGSWIGGWDFHDKENIWPDIEYFISCKPTQSQLFPLLPVPGTALYERLKAEGRLDDASRAKAYFGRTAGVQEWRKNFTEAEITAIVESAHHQLYQAAGPSIMRRLRVSLNGYKFCKNSEHPVLREERAEYHKDKCINTYPLIKACEFFAPNDKVREDIAQMREEYLEEFGKPSVTFEIMSDFVLLKASLAKITSLVGQRSPKEEPFRRYTYDREEEGELETPYKTEYPYEDERYEFEKRRFGNETKLVAKVVELMESGEQSEDASGLVKDIRAALDNVETIGNMAKLMESLGDRIGLSKGWLRSEVLKSLGTETVYVDTFANKVTIEELSETS